MQLKLKLLQIREISGEIVYSPEVVAGLMAEEAKADRECFWILHLNASNKIIEKELVSIGTVTSSLVHPREVFKKAILNGATGIITVHNHPGGQVEASRDDKIIWNRLEEAGKVLGIEVVDHLIIASSGKYHSRKEGEAQENRKEDQ
jgi:DNA repair protein RadC